MRIYKICPEELWREAQSTGIFTGSEHDARDGFIHFSTAEQLERTAKKYFAGQKNLLLIAFESEAMGEDLKFEPASDGALFPHYYGFLAVADALEVQPLALG